MSAAPQYTHSRSRTAPDEVSYLGCQHQSVVVGLTSCGMGAEDEYILIDELCNLAQIYPLVAYDTPKDLRCE